MSSRFLTLSGGRICLHEWGQGSQLLIALHGFEGSGRWFARFAEGLPPDYKLIAPDLPWHGQSDWQQPDFRPAHLTELIRRICTYAGAERFIALGFSLGARLWFQVIPDFPTNLVAGIWLAPDGVASRWGNIMRLAALPSSNWQKVLRPAESILLKLSNLLKNNRLLPPYVRQFITRNLQSPLGIHRILHTLQLLPYFGKSPKHIQSILQHSHLRQLVLVGTEDPLLNQKALLYLFQQIPNTSIYFVENEDHGLLRRPEKWAETVFQFICMLPAN